MSEGTETELSAGRRHQVLARRRMRAAGSDAALADSLPPLGTTVGGFLLESFLGEGGFGVVYLARRGGRLYAVKFISLALAAGWAHRELGVMLRLEAVGGVGLEGHGHWPDEEPLFLFIAMEYVPGEELHTWAWHHNPNALEVVDVLLPMARDLAVLHAAGVVHRDIKGDNVLVREDGRPVLVDYGVATYAGAPRVTGPEVPGCREYLSPEAVRFNRESTPGERYEATVLDDLWALGVLAYKLLTATYPFDGRNAMETEKAILQEAPEPPHERNPRVPRALSEVCMRLLEKEPGARYPEAGELAAALEEVKRRVDETWKAPLCEAWGPDAATTRRTGVMSARERLARLERVEEYEKRHPRRGHPRPAPEAASTPLPAAVEPPRRALATTPSTWALGVLALLAAGHLETAPMPAPSPVPMTPPSTSPVDFFPLTWEVTPWIGQEVAPPWKRPDGEEGAAPQRAPIPAPVANAANQKETSRVKTPRKDPAPRQDEQQPRETGARATQAGGALLFCALTTGCPGPGTQVRPEPGPAACPPGAADVMRALGATRSQLGVDLTPAQPASIITVRSGDIVVQTGFDSGKLVAGTTLVGQLIVTKSRVYGRFTKARLRSGEEYPVCYQFVGGDTPTDPRTRRPGVVHDEPSPGPDLARISSTQTVQKVEHFD